jgi:hypothetical protein
LQRASAFIEQMNILHVGQLGGIGIERSTPFEAGADEAHSTG